LAKPARAKVLQRQNSGDSVAFIDARVRAARGQWSQSEAAGTPFRARQAARAGQERAGASLLSMSEIPQDIAEALKTAGLAAFFAASASSHQNEYLKWIAEAKRPGTRKTRIEKTLKMLADKRAGEKAPAKKQA
jgi:hypothetical protein